MKADGRARCPRVIPHESLRWREVERDGNQDNQPYCTKLSGMRALRLAAVVVVTAFATLSSQTVPQDTGAAGAWQKIQKLKTTASVLHATAHPDDEQGGVLAKLSRGEGARVILMTLTRGESGDN